MEIEFADYLDFHRYQQKLMLEGAFGYIRQVMHEISMEKIKTLEELEKK